MAKKFTQREMEQLIGGIREAYETKIRQLQYRLDGLVAENRSLRASLAEYKNKENRIGRAIIAAEEKGEEIREFYRMSAETEWKTLQLFAEKWKNLAAQMAGLIPQGEADRYAEFAENLSALLGKNEGHFQPIEEKKDILNEQVDEPDLHSEEFDPKAVIGKYMDGEEETGFNLDDVINPKGVLDLEKLCKSLGLMEDSEEVQVQEKEEGDVVPDSLEAQTLAQENVVQAKPAEQTVVRSPSVAQPSNLTVDRTASSAQPAVQQAMRIAAAAKPAAQSYLRPAMPTKPTDKTQKKSNGVKKFQPPR